MSLELDVIGLIAAAGSSSRMALPKALLAFDDNESFGSRLIRVFGAAGLRSVMLTLPEELEAAEAMRMALATMDATLAPNASPPLGLSGSVLTALDRFPDAAGIVLTPVDAPFADVDLVRELAEHVAHGAPAAVPVVEGQRAHPVAFGRGSFRGLRQASRAGGPRTVLDLLGDDVIEVERSDPRLLLDLDTPEAYEAAFGVSPVVR